MTALCGVKRKREDNDPSVDPDWGERAHDRETAFFVVLGTPDLWRQIIQWQNGKPWDAWTDGDEAASAGHLTMLRQHTGLSKCTSDGADCAAMKGHLDVVRDLRSNGIHATSQDADYAAGNGHLDVVRDLRANGIHATSMGSDFAIWNEHMEMVYDLWVHDNVRPMVEFTTEPMKAYLRDRGVDNV